MGDTKPPGKAGKVTVEFIGVRGEHKGSDTLLVLCQGAYTNHISVPRHTAVA